MHCGEILFVNHWWLATVRANSTLSFISKMLQDIYSGRNRDQADLASSSLFQDVAFPVHSTVILRTTREKGEIWVTKGILKLVLHQTVQTI